MGFFDFVFASLALIFVFVLALTWMRQRETRGVGQRSAVADRDLAALRDRVAALEAIVTDQRTQLAHEIDSLERGAARR